MRYLMRKFYFILSFIFIISCSNHLSFNEFYIKNAQNEPIYVKVDGLKNASYKKLAFIQHGLASNMDHQVIQTAKQAFLAHHYVVITFDSRYSLGKSGNDVQKVLLSTFTEDLETVIDWAKKQPFYSEPFALSGHSLGGASVLQYSASHPEKVNILVPIAPVISGDLWEKSCMKNLSEFCRLWKQNGFYEYTDTKINKTAVIPYNVVTNSKSYNAYTLAPAITAKTLIIAGDKDIIIAADDVKNLVRIMPKASDMVVKNSEHNFEIQKNQEDLYKSIENFIK